MSLGILIAVDHRFETDLATTIEQAPGLEVVRRCADVAELLSSAAAGLADVAVVSPQFRGVDREAIRQLAGHGVRTVVLCANGDEEGERRFRQFGIQRFLRPTDGSDVVQATLSGGAGSASSDLPPMDGAESDAIPQDLQALGEGGDSADGDDDQPWQPSTGRVHAVWGPIGSPGRTTVAVAVADLLAKRGSRTLLIDLDTWGASLAQTLGMVDEAPGVASAARASDQGTLDVAALSRLAPEVSKGLRVLTGLPTPERWPELRAGAIANLIDVARLLADHVVIDCGFAIEDDEELSYDTAAPRRNAATLAALEAADDLLTVGSADPIGLQRLVRAVAAVGSVPSPPPTVIVNKVRASATGAHPERSITEVLSRFAGLEKPYFLPWAPEDCDAALLAGRSVPDAKSGSPFTAACADLVDLLGPARRGSSAPTERVRRSRRRTLLRRS